MFRNEFWEIIANILLRIRSIDFVKFFTANIVNRCLKHFQKITICLSQKESQTYGLSSHLDNDKEIEFLRKLSDFLLTILLPKHYSECKPLRDLLREILSVQIFLNGINLICDSHYLNQKLLDYLKWQKKELERHQKTYAYAETYEDFIKMINHCCHIEDLKRIRLKIISEIMEATVINNLKRERGIDLNKEMFSGPITSAKGDQLQARNLKRYINQLTFAKNQCEKMINTLSGSETIDSNLVTTNNKTVLGFKVIMHSDICRTYLKKFMQYSSSSSAEHRRHLIVFWESVEELRKQEISKQYQIANEILSHPNFKSTFTNLINLPKSTLKAMEEFVLGNKGPEAFYNGQEFVYDMLEHRYYPLFIVSKEYNQMLEQFHDTLPNTSDSVFEQMDNESDINDSDSIEYQDKNVINSNEFVVDDHVSQTKLKLENFNQKLNDKRNALKALKKTETEKLLNINNINVNAKLIQLLEKEIDDILRECNQLETHLENTEMWINGMGKWTTDIHSIELDNTVGSYLAIVIVYRIDITETSSNGWIVTRTHKQFIEFRRQLIKKFPVLKKFDLQKLNKSSKSKESQLKFIKQELQTFLSLLTSNENIYKSEELYLFLSQSPENLRQPISVQIKPNTKSRSLPFANLFGITYTYESQSSNELNAEDSEQLDKQFLILDDLENKENIKDDIAEPLYNLISEIFELRGVSKWLRRSLVTFVQVSYGQTINKQLRLTLEWICSESMLHYYLSSFRDSIWPNGTLSDPWPHPTDQQKKRTQTLTKQHLLNSIPDVINHLLGQQNTKKGIVKVFDGLQNKELNKQLFYVRIE